MCLRKGHNLGTTLSKETPRFPVMASSECKPDDDTMVDNNIRMLLVEAERSSNRHNESQSIDRIVGILIEMIRRLEFRGNYIATKASKRCTGFSSLIDAFPRHGNKMEINKL